MQKKDYVLILNGGAKIPIAHDEQDPTKFNAMIRGYQNGGQWVRFVLDEHDLYLDATAIQGFEVKRFDEIPEVVVADGKRKRSGKGRDDPSDI